MFYHIYGLCPTREMSGAGFAIKLWPAFRDAVAERGMTQENANTAVKTMGRAWLDGCGFSAMFDPDNPGYDPDVDSGKKKMGPNARPLYEPNHDLRVSWGEWGTEHINVPGNACGLDIDRHGIGRPEGGMIVLPHNVDSIRQAHLLLVVFCWFADCIVLDQECKAYGIKREPLAKADSISS